MFLKIAGSWFSILLKEGGNWGWRHTAWSHDAKARLSARNAKKKHFLSVLSMRFKSTEIHEIPSTEKCSKMFHSTSKL